MLLVGTLVASRRAPLDLRVASVQASGAPTLGRPQRSTTNRPRRFVGDAPWAFSALPDCFEQRASYRGQTGAVLAHLPPRSLPVRAGTVFEAATCQVRVGAHDVAIRRLADRLHVPAETTLYRAGGDLIVVRRAGQTADLRRYRVLGAP